MSLRPDLAIIADHVAPGSRVLDVGCGDGELMAELGRRDDRDLTIGELVDFLVAHQSRPDNGPLT